MVIHVLGQGSAACSFRAIDLLMWLFGCPEQSFPKSECCDHPVGPKIHGGPPNDNNSHYIKKKVEYFAA